MSAVEPPAPVAFESLPFGCVVTLPPANRSIHYGLYSANESFVHALIRHSSFRIIHVFVVGLERERAMAELKPVIESVGRKVDVAVVPLWHLGDCLAQFDYAALHWGDPMIEALAEIRNRFSKRGVPITGITHSLAFDRRLNSFRGLFSGQVRPYDAIVCTSPQAREAFRRIGESIHPDPEKITDAQAPFDCQLATIPLGVSDQEVAADAREEARRQLGLAADDKIILVMGRISPPGEDGSSSRAPRSG